MKRAVVVLLAAWLCLSAACGRSGPANLGYDPSANPTQQVDAARREGVQTGRRVLIIAGGDWCRWCHVLDEFLHDNRDVKEAMESSFVVVKVYVGDENSNEEFFSRLPEADGYPHFWVVDSSGSVRSIGTSSLEQGDDGYDKGRFLALLHDASGK